MRNEVIKIWENEINGFNPTLTTYLLDDPLEKNRRRPAVLICPGGGYWCCSPREGEPVALKFLSAGFHAFVLEYSTQTTAPGMAYTQPLLDISRAMCILRENADKWNVESDKITVCGFSAGGHLAASLGTMWDKDYIQNHPEITTGQNKPNALILGYPLITFGEHTAYGCFDSLAGKGAPNELKKELSLEFNVTADTPPTFIWHTVDDSVVPIENAMMFASALQKNKVPFEMHLYSQGPHGISLATDEVSEQEGGSIPHVATWIDLCIEWLKEITK